MAVRTYKDSKGRTRYMVEFQQAGQRVVRRCPPGVGRAEAQALETKLRGEIFAAVDLGQLPQISLDEAILRWVRDTQPHKKDQKKPAQNAVLLAPFTRGKTLRQVTDAAREAVARWATARSLGSRASGVASRMGVVPGFHPAAMTAPVAEIWEFSTLDELLSIPDVARWARNTDHKRYFMQNGFLMGELDSGMTVCIGDIERPDDVALPKAA